MGAYPTVRPIKLNLRLAAGILTTIDLRWSTYIDVIQSE